MPGSINEVMAELQQRIRQIETQDRQARSTMISSGVPAIDALLPGGGYARGSLVEWLSDGGDGGGVLSLLSARSACAVGGALIIVDSSGHFHPLAASALGLDLDRTILLRPPDATSSPAVSESDWLWAIDQSLRCPAVNAVWARLPKLDERWFRRFQLAAESSGCLGILSRPSCARHQPSWADIRWHIRPLTTRPETRYRRRLQLQLVRCRGGSSRQSLVLEIDTLNGKIDRANPCSPQTARKRTHSGTLAAELAHPAPRRRTRRA